MCKVRWVCEGDWILQQGCRWPSTPEEIFFHLPHHSQLRNVWALEIDGEQDNYFKLLSAQERLGMCQPKVFCLVKAAEQELLSWSFNKHRLREVTGQMIRMWLEKKDVLFSGAGVKMSGACESVTVNINILHLCRKVGIHRTGTPTCVHTYMNP